MSWNRLWIGIQSNTGSTILHMYTAWHVFRYGEIALLPSYMIQPAIPLDMMKPVEVKYTAIAGEIRPK